MKMSILPIAVLAMASVFVLPRMTEETVVVTVNNTMVKGELNLVYTDVETYKVEDTIAYFNYRSSDVWGRFSKGETYEITTTFWRIPLFSMYENIVAVKHLPKE